MTLQIDHLTLNVFVGDAKVASSVIDQLTQLNKKVDILMANEQDELTALQKIDEATTAIGSNVEAISTVVGEIATLGGTIDSEVKALVAKASAQGVPDSIVQAIAALGTKAAGIQTASQTVSDSLAAQKAVLDAIATEGAQNPVPVPPPPPPPVG